jgi:hypothetical protein
VPELVELLADDEAQARVLAAGALLRLTGHDQGRTPDQWRAPPADCAATLDRWRQWLVKNRDLYLQPAPRIRSGRA